VSQEERIRARKAAANEQNHAPAKRTDTGAASASSAAAASSSAAGASSSATPASASSTAAAAAAAAAEDMISAVEVKRRLRSYSEPITLFGESDAARFQRLKLFELVQHERLTSSHGATNVFAEILQQDVESEIKAAMMRDLEEQRKTQQSVDAADAEADASTAAAAAAGGASTTAAAADSGADGSPETDETGKVKPSSGGGGGSGKPDYRGRELSRSDFGTSEEFCLYFFKRMLSEWESELENRSKEVRMSAQGKMSSATQKQTRQFIKPLFKLFKTRTTPADVLRACERICTECLARQYSKADEAYLTMAIGNAAWPLGVTMVSIHERAGRTKLFSQQVARQSPFSHTRDTAQLRSTGMHCGDRSDAPASSFTTKHRRCCSLCLHLCVLLCVVFPSFVTDVLNDETQRKYIQSVKRLITYCQDHYPAPYGAPATKTDGQ
jgi:pre-mRNA-splicing factor 18